MRSETKKSYHFHAHANSLGGFVDKPLLKHIPPQASSSLPPVGGHISARTEALNFESIVFCRSAYTKVTGGFSDEAGGSGSVLVTSVVEGLNILEVVTAEKIVAQVSIHTVEGKPNRVSFAGSNFHGLRIHGEDPKVEFSRSLRGLGPKPGDPRVTVTRDVFHETGKLQADTLVKSIQGEDQVPFKWLTDRYRWHDPDSAKSKGKDIPVRCSLVEELKNKDAAKTFGHVIHIPDFGTLYLGELTISSGLIEVSMIRAELGCSTSGGVNAASASVGVHSIPP